MLTWKELKENNLEVVSVADKIKYSKNTYNVKQIRTMYKANEITFDNAMQRGKVWDVEKCSYLIHSILKNIPISSISAVNEDGVTDVLDGKQRLLCAIIGFTMGEYKLKNIPLINTNLSNGVNDDLDLNGCSFEDLPEHLRDIIDACNFEFVMIDEDTPDEDISDMFFRWNNGKPLSAVELTRVKAKSQAEIREMSNHKIFTNSMTAKALASYKNEDIVTKMWFMLNEEEPDLETKHIRKEIVDIDMTSEHTNQIKAVLDRLVAMRTKIEEILCSRGVKKSIAEKAAKKTVNKTHMISSTPFIWRTIEDGLSVEEASRWFINFYGEKATGSSSAIYNENARGGSAKKISIAKRHKALLDNYNSWSKKLAEEKKLAERELANVAAESNSYETRIESAKSKIDNLIAEMNATEINNSDEINMENMKKTEEQKIA